MEMDIIGQFQSDPRLQLAGFAMVVLIASLMGGLGRMIFATFFVMRLMRLAMFAGVGLTSYNFLT